jgi:hypothetical protein
MDAETKAELTALRRELAEHRATFAKAIIRNRAEVDARLDAEHASLEARYSKAIAACETALFRADKVDRDQTITHYRLDEIEKRLHALENRGLS